MLNSPLQLENYYFEELIFRHDAAFDATTNEAGAPLPVEELQIEIEYGHQSANERKRFYRLIIGLPPLDGRFSCSFRAVALGFFEVEAACPDEQIAMLANTNAPAVLYGVMREAIAALSGRGPLPPVCLPTAHFLDFARDAENEADTDDAAAAIENPSTPVKNVAVKKPRRTKAKS